MPTWTQIYDPFGHWWLSALVAALPIVVLFTMMAAFALNLTGLLFQELQRRSWLPAWPFTCRFRLQRAASFTVFLQDC